MRESSALARPRARWTHSFRFFRPPITFHCHGLWYFSFLECCGRAPTCKLLKLRRAQRALTPRLASDHWQGVEDEYGRLTLKVRRPKIRAGSDGQRKGADPGTRPVNVKSQTARRALLVCSVWFLVLVSRLWPARVCRAGRWFSFFWLVLVRAWAPGLCRFCVPVPPGGLVDEFQGPTCAASTTEHSR